MAIHWQVKFRSLRANTLYTVNIYDSTYSDSPVQLTGGAQPFTTDEDDDDDFFTPVRTQSGYIRIVDTGKDNSGGTFNWRDLIPSTGTDRPVTLTNGSGDVLWCGSIQTQNFGATLYETPQEREFPVQCVLSLMQGVNIDHTETAIHNFAYLLQQIVNCVPSECRPWKFVFQGGDTAKAFLNILIDWQMFLPSEDDYGDRTGMSCYEALEGVCKYWGWTVRTYGSTIYFVCVDDTAMTGMLTLNRSQLNAIAYGGNDGTTDSTMYTALTIGDVFASTQNTDSQLRGPAKVDVQSEAPESDAFNINPFDSELDDAMEEAGWRWGISYNGTTIAQTNDVLRVDRDSFVFEAYRNEASFNKVRKHEGMETGYGGESKVLEIKTTGSSSGPAKATLQTKYMHSFSQGFFMLHGETLRGADEYINTDGQTYQGNIEMFMQLGIGTEFATAKWWNGKAWQDSFTRFTVTLGNKKPDYFSRYWNGSQSSEAKNVIPTDNLYGYLFIAFYGSYAGVYGDRSFPATDGQKSFNLKDFSIEFFKDSVTTRTQYPNSGWNDVKEKKSQTNVNYTAKNGNRTSDEYSEGNIFATDNKMKPSTAILLNTNGSYLRSVTYGSSAEVPEQHKANRIASFWASSKRKIECELLTTGMGGAVGQISPRFKITIDGTTLYPLAISRDWRDDVLRVMSVEV